uniref:Uncharacterized protein n=1 Tax=Setaria viridis TaxID=4556 RepID=A0A4U6VCI2_SETVI|nr:hypothetical protein SEVIR_3G239200v2 [Setaria viridis]
MELRVGCLVIGSDGQTLVLALQRKEVDASRMVVVNWVRLADAPLQRAPHEEVVFLLQSPPRRRSPPPVTPAPSSSTVFGGGRATGFATANRHRPNLASAGMLAITPSPLTGYPPPPAAGSTRRLAVPPTTRRRRRSTAAQGPPRSQTRQPGTPKTPTPNPNPTGGKPLAPRHLSPTASTAPATTTLRRPNHRGAHLHGEEEVVGGGRKGGWRR